MITGRFFEVLSLPFLCISAGKCLHSACAPLHCCIVFHASAYWRRKIIFLRTNVVRKTEITLSGTSIPRHFPGGLGGGCVLPFMGYIGMCGPKG